MAAASAGGEEPRHEDIMEMFNKCVKDRVKNIVEQREKGKKIELGRDQQGSPNDRNIGAADHINSLNKEVEDELNRISHRLEDLKNTIGREFLKK